jgi:hypothetical protein
VAATLYDHQRSFWFYQDPSLSCCSLLPLTFSLLRSHPKCVHVHLRDHASAFLLMTFFCLRHPKPFHDHLHDHPITLRAFWWPQHSTTSPPSYLSAVHPASFLSFWWPLYSDPSAIRPRSVLLYDVTYGIWHMTYDTQNGARTRTERHSTVLGTALCFT